MRQRLLEQWHQIVELGLFRRRMARFLHIAHHCLALNARPSHKVGIVFLRITDLAVDLDHRRRVRTT